MTHPSFADSEEWMKYHQRVVDIYPRFFFNLIIVHPGVTDREIKFCALFLFECSTEEIMERMGVSKEVVHTTKSRLKKEYNLKQDEKLTVHLIQIADGSLLPPPQGFPIAAFDLM